MNDFLQFDSPDDELRDDEYPDEPVEDDGTDTFPCPHCGADIYDDSFQCPACGNYRAASRGALADWPIGWLALGLLGLAAVVFALAGLLGR